MILYRNKCRSNRMHIKSSSLSLLFTSFVQRSASGWCVICFMCSDWRTPVSQWNTRNNVKILFIPCQNGHVTHYAVHIISFTSNTGQRMVETRCVYNSIMPHNAEETKNGKNILFSFFACSIVHMSDVGIILMVFDHEIQQDDTTTGNFIISTQSGKYENPPRVWNICLRWWHWRLFSSQLWFFWHVSEEIRRKTAACRDDSQDFTIGCSSFGASSLASLYEKHQNGVNVDTYRITS